MLECIKFGDCKIKTIQIEDEWFVCARHIGIGVGPDTLKGIVRHHLPPQYKFSRKEINIDDDYDIIYYNTWCMQVYISINTS